MSLDPTLDNPDLYSDDPLTPSEKELLNFFEQTWLLSGEIPSRAKCEDTGYSPVAYDAGIRKKAFHKALSDRGIVDRSPLALTGPVYRGVLTTRQLFVANILLDFRDTRSDKKKLAECGVTTAEYQGWLKDPVFQNYMLSRSEKIINENQRDINEALLGRARGGDISAISYINKMTGYFDPDKKDITDVNAVLRQVIDIISRHLSHDSEKLGAIAAEMLSLVTPVGESGSGKLLNERNQVINPDGTITRKTVEFNGEF